MPLKLYPWLNETYNNIIDNYKKNKLHHTIVIQSYNIQDTKKLILQTSKWILCTKKKGIKNCEICKGCILFAQKNHPDLHILKPNKKKFFLEILKIRNTIHTILKTSQQYGKKILWIQNYSTLNKFGINALLKIIEEPPKNTFFFIGNKILKNIDLIFRSRCILYNIIQPIKKIGLNWIKKKKKIEKQNCLIALNLNFNNPQLAYKTLTQEWNTRKILFEEIKKSIKKKIFLNLLPMLNKKINLKINWIIILLLDVMKFKKKMFLLIINLDYKKLIYQINKKFSYYNLNKIIKSWIKCRYQLINIENVNSELLILKQLFAWGYFFLY